MAQTGKYFSSLMAFAVFLALLSGCGPEDTKVGVHLQGRVTIGKQPIPPNASAVITFSPTTVAQANPAGVQIINGAYDVNGAPKGKVLVTFDIMQEGPVQSFDGVARPQATMKSLVPEDKVKGIEVQIDGDKTDLNFDL